MEVELDFAYCAMAMFCDEKFGDVGFFVVVVVLAIIIRAVQKHHKVGVLLDGARFAKVG